MTLLGVVAKLPLPIWKDSLRRHLIDIHLSKMHNGVRCTFNACRHLPAFVDVAGFLNHAVMVHEYDLHIKLERIRKRQLLVEMRV